ncbi:hypothetical protein ACIQ7N_05590 [Lysinibacillus sp. NPDC095746]|uniref:hypothetical protein n=1 Tax=Lysinibacillus sp. NPDC095746 TaxID=3364134 RepID=UPI00380F00E8
MQLGDSLEISNRETKAEGITSCDGRMRVLAAILAWLAAEFRVLAANSNISWTI